MMKNIKLDVEYGVKMDWNKLDDWQKQAHPYTVTIKYDRKQMTIPYFMGPALSREPSEEDVLSSLVLDYYSYQNNPTFEDFCSEFGYDEDSRKAEKTYKQIIKQSKKFEKVFGPDIEKIADKYQNY